MTKALLGIDVGTGSARAGVFSERGQLLSRSERKIELWQPMPDHAEQSSDDIWQAVCGAVREALRQAGVAGESVAGIGFDATCSLVALDAEGNPVTVSTSGDDQRNIVVWMDHRAVADAAAINGTGHPVLGFVGGRISPEMQTPKLRWLKRELPDTWRRTAHWMDLPDYLSYRATGSLDRSLCTTVCKWTYLGHERRWDSSYFEAIGLGDLTGDFARIGRTVRVPGESIGVLTGQAADDLELVPDIPVATSLIDAHAGALGVLATARPEVPLGRRMAIIAGTSACHLALTERRRSVPGVWGPYFEALTAGSWLLEGGISASGAFLDHILRSHPYAEGHDDVFAHAENALAQLLRQGASMESLSGDLHIQPNVLGNRSPLADPVMKGGVAGMALDAGPMDFSRWYLAGLQSLAYVTRHIIDAFRQEDCDIELLVASGSSATNPRWCRIHADALGIPIAVPQEAEGVLLGSAMLAGTAAGLFPTVREAMSAMKCDGSVVEPDPGTKSFHDRKYQVYLQMLDDERRYRSIMQSNDR